jgi:hypothetical protein
MLYHCTQFHANANAIYPSASRFPKYSLSFKFPIQNFVYTEEQKFCSQCNAK